MELQLTDFDSTEDLYAEFKEILTTDTMIDNYYEVLIACAKPIMQDIKRNSSNRVAYQLNLNPTKLSHLTSILRVL